MQAEKRQTQIISYLREVEFASLEDLSRLVEASPSTVRRDLMALEGTGGIRRTHGGARYVTPKLEEFSYSRRNSRSAEEKDQIARVCAGLVGDRQSLILDAGSTVCQVAEYLEEKEPQIFTNSLPVANLFALSNQVEVVISGGVLYPRLGVLVGPLAERAFGEMHAELAIMGGSGITGEGVYNSHALLVGIQRAMIAAAQRVVFCLDHTKFGRKSMAHVCDLEEIDVVVTDNKAPAEMVAAFRKAGVEVIVASELPAGV